MIGRKIVLLDGRQAGEEDLAPAYTVMNDLLKQASAEVRTFALHQLKLARQATACPKPTCWPPPTARRPVSG